MAKVELTKVTKRFGSQTAVSEATLCANDGELLVMVGPSGCGKTTVLRMIAGLEEITEGELLIDAVGTTIDDRPPHRTVRARLRIRLPPRMSSEEAFHWIR